MNAVFKYDVALSYAGEDRRYAEDLAARLTKAGVVVFFDKNQEAVLWGKNLPEYLHGVYWKEARHCVMFVSSNYARKQWTIHERRAAQARAAGDVAHDYILPIRIDDTTIDGLSPALAYLDIKLGMAKICELLLHKLGENRQGSASDGVSRGVAATGRRRTFTAKPARGQLDPTMAASGDKPSGDPRAITSWQGRLGILMVCSVGLIALVSFRGKQEPANPAASERGAPSVKRSPDDSDPAGMSEETAELSRAATTSVASKQSLATAGDVVTDKPLGTVNPAREPLDAARPKASDKRPKNVSPKKVRASTASSIETLSLAPCADPNGCDTLQTGVGDAAEDSPSGRQPLRTTTDPAPARAASLRPPLTLQELRAYESKF